nr:aspartic proteinase oryzasin-1-like [Ipomoea trifida]
MARVCVGKLQAILILNSSKVLVNALFIASNCSSWSRSSESLNVLVNPLCVVFLVNTTAPENGEGDRVLEEQFSENDQHEVITHDKIKKNENHEANGWKASLAAVGVKSLIGASFGNGTDLNAGEQKNDDDLFADVSFRNSNGKEHESDLFYALAFCNSPFIGQQLHALAIKSNLILDIFVGCNALDMYSKTSIREFADKVFLKAREEGIEPNAFMGDFLIGNNSTGFCEGDCAAIVDYNTSLLTGPTTIVTEINHAIGAEGIVSTECKEIVSQYGEMIWDLLVSGVKPDEVCSQVGLCFFNGAAGSNIEMVVEEDNEGKSSSDPMCTACEMVVVWVQNQLKQRGDQGESF